MQNKSIKKKEKGTAVLTLGRADEAGSDEIAGKKESRVNSLGGRDPQPDSVELPNFAFLGARLL